MKPGNLIKKTEGKTEYIVTLFIKKYISNQTKHFKRVYKEHIIIIICKCKYKAQN